jgi:hypothetical protein
MRETLDEPQADGLGDDDHHDWNRARCLLHCQRRRRRRSDDHVNLEPHQLFSTSRITLVLPLGPAVLNDKVLTFDPTEAAKGLLELKVGLVTEERCQKYLLRSGRAARSSVRLILLLYGITGIACLASPC